MGEITPENELRMRRRFRTFQEREAVQDEIDRKLTQIEREDRAGNHDAALALAHEVNALFKRRRELDFLMLPSKQQRRARKSPSDSQHTT